MGAKKIAEAATEAALITEISRVISEITGVQLGEKQFALVQGRLGKRMRDLRITDPLEYSRYYNANQVIETGILTSLLTTHHTFFFREFQHFEYLLKVTLPTLIASHREKGLKTIRIWSAACSRGQEVYSLTMFLRQHLSQMAPEMDYEIVGTDVCEESIAIAKNGVYTWDELRVVPAMYLQGNWTKGTGSIAQYVRAKEDIRKNVSFRVQNLMELNQDQFGQQSKFDLIFCRNVFIYFTHSQIKSITSDMLKLLNPSGHLFIGLSESLNGLGLPIEWVGPSVYEQKKAKAAEVPAQKVLPIRPASPATSIKAPSTSQTGILPKVSPPPRVLETPHASSARKIRVLCVDDSPTVLLLLKRILTPERGFELVGTAADGLDAAEKARALKPDIITLDIHMPRMTGVEFLEKHFKEIKAPVVIVSSVPREDSSLAFRCLELGASDYIEKPSASNLDKVDEELVFKLKVADEAWRKSNGGPTRSRALELDASFRRSPAILSPEGKLRVIVCDFSSRDVAQVLLRGFQGKQPPTLVLFEGAGDVFKDWVAKNAPATTGGRTQAPKALSELQPGTVSFLELEKGMDLLRAEGRKFVISCLVVGPMSRAMVQQVTLMTVNHLVVEDRGSENPLQLLTKASLVVPLTSFVYESDRFLSESEVKK